MIEVTNTGTNLTIKGAKASLFRSKDTLYIKVNFTDIINPADKISVLSVYPDVVGIYTTRYFGGDKFINYHEAYELQNLIDTVCIYTNDKELANFLLKLKEIAE